MIDPQGDVSVSFSRVDAVATLTIDREAKLNALTLSMLDALHDACEAVESSAARVVVIRTAGSRAFSVGADITHFAELDAATQWSEWIATGHRAFDRLASLDQPTVAVVDGLALGGGLELALACDLRLMTSGARLGLPEAGLGTVPGWGGTARLASAVGRSRALDMMLTRRQVTADEALAWGLTNRVADESDLDTALDDLLDDLLGSAPTASQLIKKLVDGSLAGGTTSILEGLAGGLASTTTDLREGVAAFVEKRAPRFTGA